MITSEAFERRLDQAIASQNHQEIFNLAADLDKTTDSEFSSQKERQFNVNYAASDNDETEDNFDEDSADSPNDDEECNLAWNEILLSNKLDWAGGTFQIV